MIMTTNEVAKTGRYGVVIHTRLSVMPCKKKQFEQKHPSSPQKRQNEPVVYRSGAHFLSITWPARSYCVAQDDPNPKDGQDVFEPVQTQAQIQGHNSHPETTASS